ncbi:MAG: glutamate synthase-related protein, partial [Candidatus Omnitrophica bacterium]|nr:glutamate synthase-related protein [Candidatus Omnitrophota bacterium]
YASDAKIDLLIIDGAGGGTGMSPWRMMNEWGIPTVYLESLTYQYCEILSKKGKFIPTIAIAGGFCFEDQIFKGLALGAPYVKLIAMGRAPITAAMVGKTIGKLIKEGKIPQEYKEFGDTIEQIFIASADLKKRFGKDFDKIPPSAIGLYTYFDRLATGLKQFMAGARKFSLKYISRDDIFALTKEASEVSGIPYVMDLDKEQAEKMLLE